MQGNAPKVRISVLQFFVVVITSTTAFGHFVWVHLAITRAGRDAWASLVLGCLAGLVFTYVNLKHSAQHPNQSLTERIVSVFGKWAGGFLSIIYTVFFLFVIAITMKIVTDFMSVIYPTTPSGVFMFGMYVVSGWGAYKGIETLTRAAQFVLPFLILLGISASLLSMEDKDFTEILPLLQNGWLPIAGGAFIFTSMFCEMIVFATISGYVNDARKLPRYGMLWVGIAFIMFLAPTTGPVMLFGEAVARSLAFPTYSEIQYIHLQNVIERFDVVGVLLWTNGSFFRMAVYLFGAAKNMADLFQTDNNRFVIPLTLVAAALTLSITQSSREEVYIFLGTTFIYVTILVGFVLPLLTITVGYIRSKFKPQGRVQRATG